MFVNKKEEFVFEDYIELTGDNIECDICGHNFKISWDNKKE